MSSRRMIPPDTRVPIAWTTAEGFSLVHRARAVPGAPATACGEPVPEEARAFLVGASSCGLAGTDYCPACWSWRELPR